MPDESPHLDLAIFSALSEIPHKCKSQQEALQRIAELGRRALAAHACTLVFVDQDKRELSLEAWAGFGAWAAITSAGAPAQKGA